MPSQPQKKVVAKITKKHAELDKRPGPAALVIQLLSEASTEEEKAKIIFSALINASEKGQECNEVVALCHERAEVQESWNFLGLNREEFNELICYESIVAPAVEAYRKTDRKKKIQAAFIEEKWGKAWRTAADPKNTLLPEQDSERTLGSIRRICQKMTPEVFSAKLEEAIDNRLDNWRRGRRTNCRGTLTDLQYIEKSLAQKTLPPCALNPRKRLLDTAKSSNEGEESDADDEEDAETAHGSGCNTDTPASRQKRRKLWAEAGETTNADSTSDSASESAPTKRKTSKKDRAIGGFRTCGCKSKSEARVKLTNAKKHGLKDTKAVIKSIEYLEPTRATTLCWNHLRDFCTAVGLRTRTGGRKNLLERLAIVWKKRYELGKLKTDPRYRDWFVRALRGAIPEDRLGTLRFMPEKEPKFVFNATQILQRYAGNAAKKWETDGTIIVQGAMDWLFQDPEILELMEQEVQMYLHHRRMVDGMKSLGWLRSAYYTQIQQIARQDPVYYALVAATSREMWQISYPYYMKATLPGDGILFQHIDLNVNRYIECGRGARRIQTSFTLTQETETNCTMVVPGFHRHIKSWWQEVLERDNARRDLANHSGNCLKTNDVFTAEDKEKYGDFVPAVCGPGDIRISRAEIIHGSAADKEGKAGDERRWVVNPWFVAIQPDHDTLDVPECGTWATIAQAHRDQMAPASTPSGQANTHGRPLDRFPASVPLRHISHLSDALIGQARWDDPLVQFEAAVVLGNDDSAAWEFVNSCRQRMIRQYKFNMGIIRDIEKAAYGKNSYFRLLECGLYREPQFEGDYSGEAPQTDDESDHSDHSSSSNSSKNDDEAESDDSDEDRCPSTGSLDDL